MSIEHKSEDYQGKPYQEPGVDRVGQNNGPEKNGFKESTHAGSSDTERQAKRKDKFDVSERLTKLRQQLEDATEKINNSYEKLTEKQGEGEDWGPAGNFAVNIGKKVERKVVGWILESRESRLKTKAENEKMEVNRVQKFLRDEEVGWVIQTAAQAMPSFAGYGPGDILTLYGTVRGKTLLTGEKLDKVDRVLYGVATAIPFVPGTLLSSSVVSVRKSVEDWVYAREMKDEEMKKKAQEDLQKGLGGLQDRFRTVRDGVNQPKRN